MLNFQKFTNINETVIEYPDNKLIGGRDRLCMLRQIKLGQGDYWCAMSILYDNIKKDFVEVKRPSKPLQPSNVELI